jgi:hypothetical protein
MLFLRQALRNSVSGDSFHSIAHAAFSPLPETTKEGSGSVKEIISLTREAAVYFLGVLNLKVDEKTKLWCSPNLALKAESFKYRSPKYPDFGGY